MQHPTVSLRGPLFLGKLLSAPQTVTKSCGFGNRTILPHLGHTVCVLPPSVESLGWPHIAEFSDRETRVLHRYGTFVFYIPRKLLSGNQMV